MCREIVCGTLLLASTSFVWLVVNFSLLQSSASHVEVLYCCWEASLETGLIATRASEVHKSACCVACTCVLAIRSSVLRQEMAGKNVCEMNMMCTPANQWYVKHKWRLTVDMPLLQVYTTLWPGFIPSILSQWKILTYLTFLSYLTD